VPAAPGEVVMGEGLFQPLHLLIILGIALLIFGPSKLAGLGKGLGEGIRNFKDSMKDDPKPPAAPSDPEKKA
jgi:sec-independent protein translocase protein TatA